MNSKQSTVSSGQAEEMPTRKVLFRGKVFGKENWVFGSLIQRSLRYGSKYSILVLAKDLEFDDEEIRIEFQSIGQFTGYEFGGRKVFEGDIIETVNMRNGDKYRWIVYWSFGAWYTKDNDGNKMDLQDFFEDSDYPEIIGNIHDNPDLMEKEVVNA